MLVVGHRTAFYPSPFPALAPYATIFTRSYPNNPPVGVALDAHRLVVQLDYNSLLFDNVTLQAADFPPEEARGVPILPPMQCGGATDLRQPLAASNSNRVFTLGPLYALSSSAELAAALTAATQQQFMFPPMFMLFANSTLSPGSQPLALAPDFVIAGPTVPDSTVVPDGDPTGVTLDMQSMPASSFVLTGQHNGVFLQRLTLSLPAPGPSNSSDSSTGMNAMLLWAFQADR